MSPWRRSVGELPAAQGSVAECKKAQASLTRVTACFQQLAMCVGGSTDCSRLREELEDTRLKAHHICTGLQGRLTALLTGAELGPEEREEAERLWVLFLSGLDLFLQDLHKTAALQALFPLSQPRDRRALLHTGAAGRTAEVAARAALVQAPWGQGEKEAAAAAEPPPDLGAHIAQLERMAQDLLQRVSVPIWSVEATQEAWAEGSLAELDPDDRVTSEELLTVEELSQGAERQAGCCRYPGCRLGWILCLVN